MKREYGVQMYSVRDIAEKDFNAAIQAVAKLGYKKLEFAGFFDKTADEVCRYMEDAGVVCGGTHSNCKLLFPETIDETIAYVKAIGNRRFIIPGATLNTLEQIDDFVSVVNAAEKKLSAAGIDLAYHNHSKEFVTMYWGNTIHNELAQRTDMKFEIDTYWAFNAGVDPVVLCERLKDRIPVIHLKDGFFGGRGVALGEGEAPVKRVYDMAIRNGFDIVVESEGLNPTGVEEVGRCMDYLKKLEA